MSWFEGFDQGCFEVYGTLDHPTLVKKMCLLNIAPTLDMYEGMNMDFARHDYHWFLLIQPAPLPGHFIPEQMHLETARSLRGFFA